MAFILSGSDYRVGGTFSENDRQEVESFFNEAEVLYLSKFKLDSNFVIHIYICKNGEEFSKLTGANGWNGGHSRGNTIFLQRIEALRQRRILGLTIMHEFLHFCIGRVAGRNCPVWINEGIVLNLSGEIANLDCTGINTGNLLDEKTIEENIRSGVRDKSKEGYCKAGIWVGKLIQRAGFEKILECLVSLKTGNRKPLDSLNQLLYR